MAGRVLIVTKVAGVAGDVSRKEFGPVDFL
jgi:hypothetical protein